MIIKYGIVENNIDVTTICYDNLCNDGIMRIPSCDFNRTDFFGDPLPNVHKYIIITNSKNETISYNSRKDIYIDIKTEEIIKIIDDDEIETKLKSIHNNLQLYYGSIMDEYPEQMMSVRYLTGNEKVLEIGGNIGRNSLVIAHILKEKNNNFVSLESDKDIADQLTHNRNINNFHFHIEPSALSKRSLIQRGWETFESNELIDNYKVVSIINYEQLCFKYNIVFDTLILDCEGAFYNILKDMPEILDNVKLIIMENDYTDINKKIYVDNILKRNGFKLDYKKFGGWGPCYYNFYEVWIK